MNTDTLERIRVHLCSSVVPPFQVSLAHDRTILEESRELLERDRLRGIDERPLRLRVNISEDEIRPRDDSLRRDVEDVLYAVRRLGAHAHGMRWIDAHG